jgi:transcriptional regulator with XRE-family HTH domain
MRSMDDFISNLPVARRVAIEARGAKLVEEEKTLQEIRKALHLTQETVAEALNIKQVNISTLEKRSDFLISTLRKYIQAMGGELNLIAEFPGYAPVKISSLADLG